MVLVGESALCSRCQLKGFSQLPVELPPLRQSHLRSTFTHNLLSAILNWSTSAISTWWEHEQFKDMKSLHCLTTLQESLIPNNGYQAQIYHHHLMKNPWFTTGWCNLLFSWWCYCAAVRVKMILKSVSGDSAGPALLWNSAISFRGRVQAWCGAEEDKCNEVHGHLVALSRAALFWMCRSSTVDGCGL